MTEKFRKLTSHQPPPPPFPPHPLLSVHGGRAGCAEEEALLKKGDKESHDEEPRSGYDLDGGIHHEFHHGNVFNAVPVIAQLKSGGPRTLVSGEY